MRHKSRATKNQRKNQKENNKAQKSVSLSENQDESPSCNAVLSTQSKTGGDEEMKEEAKLALEIALQEDFHVENVRGELFVGNHGGLYHARMSAEVQAVKDELASRKTEHVLLRTEWEAKYADVSNDLLTLKADLLTLKALQKKHPQARNRFISFFKRDKLNTNNSLDDKIIIDGNIVVHGGDAFADAALYTSLNLRSDTDTFVTLYGLRPEQVSRIEPTGLTIVVLNTHATIISSKAQVATEKFYNSFALFIQRLQKSNYNESCLKTLQLCPLTQAYTAFLQCNQNEVHNVPKVKQD